MFQTMDTIKNLQATERNQGNNLLFNIEYPVNAF